MVALLVGLKLRLLRASLRADPWQVVGVVVAALAGLGFTVAGVAALVALRFVPDAGTAAAIHVGGGTALLLGWILVPLLAFGVDETLDPARFALLPLRGRDLVPGLTVAALIGVPGLATAVVVASTVVTWTRGVVPFLLAVVSAAVGLATCIVASRLFTTAGARVLSTRRAREIGTVLGVLLVSSIGLVPLLVSTQISRAADLGQFVQWLGWSPLGWAWAAPGDAATGHLGRGVVRLVLAVLLLLAGAYGWGTLLGWALQNQTGGGRDRRSGPGSRVGARAGAAAGAGVGAGRRTPLLDRLPTSPVVAVAVRCMRYWRRDPRYVAMFSSLLIATVVPVLAITFASRQAGASGGPPAGILLGVGPFLGLLIGLSASNDLGYDSTAFAAHLLTGLPGRADRAGRLLALLVWAVPVVCVAALVSCRVADRLSLVPGVVGLSVGSLLGAVAASSVGGALAPYPMPEAGANPFRANAGGSARVLLAQAASGAVALTVALPSAVGVALGALGWAPGPWLALVVGPAAGVVVLVIAIQVGGRVVDHRGPEILAAVRKSQ